MTLHSFFSGFSAALGSAPGSHYNPRLSECPRCSSEGANASRRAFYRHRAESRALQHRSFSAAKTRRIHHRDNRNGVAIFDYDNDGWPDIFVVNRQRNWKCSPRQAPIEPPLFSNNHDGTFTRRHEKPALLIVAGAREFVGTMTRWLRRPLRHLLRHELLYHNNGDGTFIHAAKKLMSPARKSLGHRLRLYRLRPRRASSI